MKLTHKIDENNIFSIIGFLALDRINFVVDDDTNWMISRMIPTIKQIYTQAALYTSI